MATLRIDHLISSKTEKSHQMSWRMVKSASTLPEGEHIGWQMLVPKKGLVDMCLYGTGSITEEDLAWFCEETGVSSTNKRPPKEAKELQHIYELYLPVTQSALEKSPIGFGARPNKTNETSEYRWPTHFAEQFEELVRAFQQTGAMFQVAMGPASKEEIELCRKNTVRTFPKISTDINSYIGSPVKARFLLRLPDRPSMRLRTVLIASIPGVAIRYLGTMQDSSEEWHNPLKQASTLPESAVRILLQEPNLEKSMVGIEVQEERAKSIPASHQNPKDMNAIVIGEAETTTGERTTITLADVDLKRHYQIVGQTGTGKSSMLVGLICSAVATGHGLTFFDPHGTTIDMILRATPKKYANRIRVVRIGDADKNPVPLNLWDSDDPTREEKNINDFCELIADIFDPKKEGIVGPRYERWLSTFAKASIAFLGSQASLESIAILSQSESNMKKLYHALNNDYPELATIIKEEYGLNGNSSDFHDLLNWLLCKFQRLTAIEQLRNVFGAGANALDFAHTIDTDMVTLIDLASPEIGTHAARIAGTLVLMKLWNAVLGRKNREMNHLVVIDEASLFQTNPMPRMLAEGRKFGISMVLCHQHSGQMVPAIRDALESNSANFSAFRLSPSDAVVAATRLDMQEMISALPRLDAFRAITTLSVNGQQTELFTLEIPKPKIIRNGEKNAVEIEERSREMLVEPYRDVRALSAKEIQQKLDNIDSSPNRKVEKEEYIPGWLKDYKSWREEIK